VVVDCLPELDRLQEAAERHQTSARVMIRVRPGIKAHTHELIQTGQEDSKFGLGLPEGEALAAARRCAELSRLELAGIHCHIGSQIFGVESFERAVEVMLGFLREASDAAGHAIPSLNLGGGLGIKYTHEDAPPTVDHFAEVVCRSIEAGAQELGIPRPRLILEPGRSIVGEAGTTLYRIGVIKEIPGVRNYVAVDGGLSDNPRPALYGAEYEAVVANKADQPATFHVRVSGAHCETDTLIPDIAIQPAEPGDILAVFSTGAYNYAMASNYNRFCRPAVVLVCDGQADIIVERESLDDVIRLDRIPARLA
jgi:diaminopimelate decarboxylase